MSKQTVYNKSGGSSNASEIINQLHYFLIESGKGVHWYQKGGVRDLISKH